MAKKSKPLSDRPKPPAAPPVGTVEDVPPQVSEDETAWAAQVSDRHLPKENPALAEERRRLAELVRKARRDKR